MALGGSCYYDPFEGSMYDFRDDDADPFFLLRNRKPTLHSMVPPSPSLPRKVAWPCVSGLRGLASCHSSPLKKFTHPKPVPRLLAHMIAPETGPSPRHQT